MLCIRELHGGSLQQHGFPSTLRLSPAAKVPRTGRSFQDPLEDEFELEVSDQAQDRAEMVCSWPQAWHAQLIFFIRNARSCSSPRLPSERLGPSLPIDKARQRRQENLSCRSCCVPRCPLDAIPTGPNDDKRIVKIECGVRVTRSCP